jgi:hypothetical protein
MLTSLEPGVALFGKSALTGRLIYLTTSRNLPSLCSWIGQETELYGLAAGCAGWRGIAIVTAFGAPGDDLGGSPPYFRTAVVEPVDLASLVLP